MRSQLVVQGAGVYPRPEGSDRPPRLRAFDLACWSISASACSDNRLLDANERLIDRLRCAAITGERGHRTSATSDFLDFASRRIGQPADRAPDLLHGRNRHDGDQSDGEAIGDTRAAAAALV